MYCAFITELGETKLEEAAATAAHHALAALVSPPLEAPHPRALFDAFCGRLGERFGAPQSTDACRVLWRRLCGDGVIVVRGSLQTDAGRSFARIEPLARSTQPRPGGKRDGDERPAREYGTELLSNRSASATPNPPGMPFIPRRVSDFFRDALVRLVRVADGV